MSGQQSDGWVHDGSSSGGPEKDERGSEERIITEVEAALAQGIASSLRTLVIASFRAPPNKFVLGETNGRRGSFAPRRQRKCRKCPQFLRYIEAGTTFATMAQARNKSMPRGFASLSLLES